MTCEMRSRKQGGRIVDCLWLEKFTEQSPRDGLAASCHAHELTVKGIRALTGILGSRPMINFISVHLVNRNCVL